MNVHYYLNARVRSNVLAVNAAYQLKKHIFEQWKTIYLWLSGISEEVWLQIRYILNTVRIFLNYLLNMITNLAEKIVNKIVSSCLINTVKRVNQPGGILMKLITSSRTTMFNSATGTIKA